MKKRPAFSTSAHAASILLPLKSSSSCLRRSSTAEGAAILNFASSARYLCVFKLKGVCVCFGVDKGCREQLLQAQQRAAEGTALLLLLLSAQSAQAETNWE